MKDDARKGAVATNPSIRKNTSRRIAWLPQSPVHRDESRIPSLLLPILDFTSSPDTVRTTVTWCSPRSGPLPLDAAAPFESNELEPVVGEVAQAIAPAAVAPPAPGSWTALPANPVDRGANNIILLTDGSVLVNSGGVDQHQWTRLAPDASGSYVTGTWLQVASSFRGRLYFPSFILRDGRLWLGGGEDIQDADKNTNATEIDDSVANTWTQGPEGLFGDIGDAPSAMLPDGRILLGHRFSKSTHIYPTTNSFSTAAEVLDFSNSEANWQLLADGSVFDTIRTSERYLPSSNQWIAAAPSPVTMSSDGELGPVVYLPDGRVFVASDRNATAYFTPPTTLTGTGSWTVGPSLPNSEFAADVPAALEPNGKVLLEGTVASLKEIGHFTSSTRRRTPTKRFPRRCLLPHSAMRRVFSRCRTVRS